MFIMYMNVHEYVYVTAPVLLALLRAGFKPTFLAWEMGTLTRIEAKNHIL